MQAKAGARSEALPLALVARDIFKAKATTLVHDGKHGTAQIDHALDEIRGLWDEGQLFGYPDDLLHRSDRHTEFFTAKPEDHNLLFVFWTFLLDIGGGVLHAVLRIGCLVDRMNESVVVEHPVDVDD